MKPSNDKTHVYLHDGTCQGALTAIFLAWTDRELADICAMEKYNLKFIDTQFSVKTDDEKADRIRIWVVKNFGYDIFVKIYRVLLTEQDGCEMKVIRYLKYIAGAGIKGCRNYMHIDVVEINKLETAFCNETHKLYGFLRFESLKGGIMYAEIGPKYNQLEPLMTFFHDRLQGEKLVIYDTKRKMAAICDGKTWYISTAFDSGLKEKEGVDYEEMWRSYLQALAIKERENYKQQRQMMPLRYRTFMTEFQEKGEATV